MRCGSCRDRADLAGARAGVALKLGDRAERRGGGVADQARRQADRQVLDVVPGGREADVDVDVAVRPGVRVRGRRRKALKAERRVGGGSKRQAGDGDRRSDIRDTHATTTITRPPRPMTSCGPASRRRSLCKGIDCSSADPRLSRSPACDVHDRRPWQPSAERRRGGCDNRLTMPIYEYRCRERPQFEVFQSMSDDPVTACQECGAPVERVFHPVAVHFKGSGFYTTDYARKGRRARQSADDGGRRRTRRSRRTRTRRRQAEDLVEVGRDSSSREGDGSATPRPTGDARASSAGSRPACGGGSWPRNFFTARSHSSWRDDQVAGGGGRRTASGRRCRRRRRSPRR